MPTKIEWKILEFFPTYQINTDGIVRNIQTGRILKKRIDKDGYCDILLSQMGFKQRFKIHRLVASTFILNPKYKPEVNHKNGIKTDNRVGNLEWVTRKENEYHSVINNLHTSKININQVYEIRELYNNSKITMQIIADIYKISKSQVSKIINKKSWEHA